MNILLRLIPKFLRESPLDLGIQEQRLIWLVRLRLIALFSQLPLTLLGRYYGYLDQSSHLIFTIALIILIAYNAHLYRAIVMDHKKSSKLYITLQMTLDLIAFTGLLSISGGANNPFYAFFYAMAVMGGIFSTGRSSIIFGLTFMLSILIIQMQPLIFLDTAFQVAFSPVTFPYLISQLFIPLVTFLIARSFGELLDKSQERLLAMTVHTERVDRLRALGSLSAGFSHEFASPLQNVKLRINRIFNSQNIGHDDYIECKSSIEDCELVLRRMNQAQLHFSEEDLEEIEISQLTAECLENWKNSYPEFSLHFSSETGLIKVSRVNFVQALFNLLDNAVEASLNEKILAIKIFKQEGKIVLSVTDKGAGFHRDVLERIGEPFNTNKQNGTGLGLYSANLFMASIGGTLKIKNNTTAGSTIELIFPSRSTHE